MPFLARHTRPALAGTLLAVAAANSQDKPLAGQAIRDRDACGDRGRHVCRAEQSGPSAGQIGQSAHSRAARRTGICGSWTPAETHCSPGATWRSSRSGFRSCTGASNAHVSALPKPCAKTSGFCLMLPVRTSRQPRPMSWPEVTGTLGTSRPGPCGTGGLPPLGEPRQRHWHLACRRDATAMTPGPRPPSPMAIRRLAGRARCGRGSSWRVVRELSPTAARYEVLRAAARHHVSSGRSLAGGVTARGPAAPPQPGGEQPSG